MHESFNVCIFVNLVNEIVLTMAGEVRRYRNDCYDKYELSPGGDTPGGYGQCRG